MTRGDKLLLPGDKGDKLLLLDDRGDKLLLPGDGGDKLLLLDDIGNKLLLPGDGGDRLINPVLEASWADHTPLRICGGHHIPVPHTRLIITHKLSTQDT